METSAPDSQALPAGTRLEEFMIERVLGSGGFGITYLARDTSLNRQVVIKENLPSQFVWRETATGTVRPRHTTGSDTDDFEWSMRNFLREAETLASLDHPGIVRVLRKFEANSTGYFVMPFVQGVEFGSLIAKRAEKGQPFTEEELRGLTERLLDALSYLHDRGIYHRDIKPTNILITSEGVPVLIDFGSARQRLSDRSMTVVESAGYTPFEQLQSRGNVGPWSDLYAFGATIVKALTFEALPKAADRIRKDPHIPLAKRNELMWGGSQGFLRAIDKATAVDEEARWQNAKEWLTALKGDDPMRACSVSQPAPPPLPTQVYVKSQTSVSVRSKPKPAGKAKVGSWIFAACAVLGMFAFGVVVSNQTRASERRARQAETARMDAQRKQEQTALAEAQRQQAEAARRDAQMEQERIAVMQARQAADLAAAEATKDQEEAARLAEEEKRLAELARAKEDAARQEVEQQRTEALAKDAKLAEEQRLKEAAAHITKVNEATKEATKEKPFVNSLGMKFVPVNTATGGRLVLFSIWETRRKDYAAYAAAEKSVDASWENAEANGQPVGHGEDHPVVCVNWDEAVAFNAWLTKRERATGMIPQNAAYRLPTDTEWSWAAGIGEEEDVGKTPKEKTAKLADVHPWDGGVGTWPPPKGAGNYCGQETKGKFGRMISGYNDGFATTAPVGRFRANSSGIYDLGGNVWEWCGSYYHGRSGPRVFRGGSWDEDARGDLLSSCRGGNSPSSRYTYYGFRCVLVMSSP
jgi:serine/threonine protein kinase/formylglycine-generating enzyme required for sulfatase activity